MSNYQLLDLEPTMPDSCEEIVAGLTTMPKRIHPKFFYDAEGSRLFDAITDLPEYYLKRAELGILAESREEIAATVGAGVNLIEFGSGSSEKIHTLIDEIRPELYMPIDISKEHLDKSSRAVAETHLWLKVKALCADYGELTELPDLPQNNRTVGFFPGSSLGNCPADEATAFLVRIRAMIGAEGGLLIGIDCTQKSALLKPAYNDMAGTTAAFNLNALTNINNITGSRFSPDLFQHMAIYNEEEQRMEMYLRSTEEQKVEVQGHRVSFQEGETIHTEYSHKWSRETFLDMATAAGFNSSRHWKDDNTGFSVFYLSAQCHV